MIKFLNDGMDSPEEMSKYEVIDLNTIITRITNYKHTKELLRLAQVVATKYEGCVPSTKQELLNMKVKDSVAGKIMQNVYGSTELVITLTFRKVMVALDMFDWEEYGAKTKDEVKMVDITADRVRASLLRWMPIGEKLAYQEAVEIVGNLLSKNTQGMWGLYTKILTQHFSSSEKKELVKMSESIMQFYNATRGTRKRPNPFAELEAPEEEVDASAAE